MTTDSKAVCGGGENQAARWLPIETAPTDRPVVVRMRTDRLSGGWFVATVTLPDPEDESRFAGSSTIWHYNGDILMSRFRGMWTHWLCDEPAALASTAGAGAGDWVTVPRDDERREVADSALPVEMIAAGSAALDRARSDLDNYVPGETPDWDTGMIAVAVYRAMTEVAPAVPASPRSGAGEGEGTLSTAERQRLGQVAMEAFGDKGFGLDIGRGVFEHAVDRVVSALSQADAAGRSERAVEIRELSEKATTGAPCHWGGGNDIIWCSTCGAQYAYAKGEERPPCPRLPAPAQSPSTSDAEG